MIRRSTFPRPRARHGACKGLASLATPPYPGNHETGERVRKNAMRLAPGGCERLR